MNCPFYGRQMYSAGMFPVQQPMLLLDTKGNQCALVTISHMPCFMESGMQQEPDWKTCPLVRDMRMEPES